MQQACIQTNIIKHVHANVMPTIKSRLLGIVHSKYSSGSYLYLQTQAMGRLDKQDRIALNSQVRS